MQRFASLAIFATAASAVDTTITRTWKSPEMSVTEGSHTAKATISYDDTYTSKCITGATEQVRRDATLTVQIDLDKTLPKESQVDVYHCGVGTCYVWSWTNDDGYMRQSTVAAADFAVGETERPWYKFANGAKGKDQGEIEWTIPADTAAELTKVNSCRSSQAFCNDVVTLRAPLNLVGATKFDKAFTGKSTYSFSKDVVAAVKDSLTGEEKDLGLGDTWTAGIFFRTAAYDTANPQAGATSKAVTIDFKDATGSMSKKITDFSATKPATCNPCKIALLTGTGCDTCSNGKDPATDCVADFKCANGTTNYPVCKTCPTGRSGDLCKSCTNGNTGDNCEIVSKKDSAVSTVAMTSSAAVIAFGALAF